MYIGENKLFIDKYKPNNFLDINYSKTTNIQLQSLSKINNFPHIILKGFRGCGKKLRALLFLKEKYNKDVFKLETFNMECKVLNKSEPIVLSVIHSPYHYQINLSSHGVYDRILLEYFLKEITSYKTTNIYKIIIIEDTDNLTIEAQQSLRRTLETRISNSRFIFIVNNEGFLIDPLYSRCIVIPVVSPENREMFNVLHMISEAENIEMDNKKYNIIINNSNRNLHKAITILNNYKITGKILNNNDCTEDINIICSIILKFDKIEKITQIREKLNKLLINNLNKTYILKEIFNNILLNNKNKKIIYNIIKLTSKYDVNIKKSGKNIYHLEGYCLNLIEIINNN